MGECISEYPGTDFVFDFCQTKKTLPGSLRKSTGISEDYFGRQNYNYFIHAELDYFDRILQEHYKEPVAIQNVTNDCLAWDEYNLSSINVNKKPQLNLRQVSDQLLQKLQEKRVNLVLVATSLDENDVVQKLSDSLDPQTSSMIPLSFDENNNSINQLNSGLVSLKHESITDNRKHEENQPKNNSSSRTSASLATQQKDDKYWKRRTSNNEAARRSREAKRSRFIWIQKRTKELEFENASLQEELSSLKKKVLGILEK